jgi:hypothetical protein
VAGVGVNWGTFYDGSSTEWSADLGWKPSRFYGMGVSYQRSAIHLLPSPFAIDEVVGRINFSLTPKLFGAIFAQWNNDANELLFNFRATWIPKPGAYIYFVLNEFGETLDPRWRLNKTVAMIKFVWYLATK